MKISNFYNFANLDGFKFDWELVKAGRSVGAIQAKYRVEPMTNFRFPLSMDAVTGADRLRVAIHDSDEGFSVSVPGLPGCWSQGATEQEALDNIRDAIREYLAVVNEQLQGEEVREVEITV